MHMNSALMIHLHSELNIQHTKVTANQILPPSLNIYTEEHY